MVARPVTALPGYRQCGHEVAVVVCGLVFLVLLLLGCNDVTGQACTLIGCSDGLNVEVQGVMSDVSVEATSATGETRTAPCQAFSDSTCWVHFDDFVPDEVTIRVADGDNQVSVTTKPAYESLQPNGPDCPPTCRQATVVIGFGSAG